MPHNSVQTLYTPLQPALNAGQNGVHYRETAPHPALRPYIHCYWELYTGAALAEPYTYRVVADACMDIFFETDAPERNYIMGFSDCFTQFPLGKHFRYTGIRFLPGMFPLFSKLDASELHNRAEPLQHILPGTARFLSDAFNTYNTSARLCARLDAWFLQLLPGIQQQPDPRFAAALQRILQNGGNTLVEKELDTGISSRQLRRLFRFYTGDSAKTFSQVVRFQYFLQSRQYTDKAFFDAGYYDQAHFIKEFRNFYGTTPGQAFKK